MGKRCLTVKIFVALVVIGHFGAVAQEKTSGLKELDTAVKKATMDMVKSLEKQVRNDAMKAIAVVPFTDGKERIPKIGRRAANIVNNTLVKKSPAWLKVQTRMQLSKLNEERKLWASDLVRQEERSEDIPAGFTRKADFLLVGTVSQTRSTVTLNMQLITTKDGRKISTEHVTVELTPDLRDLLAYLDRPKDAGATDNMARVSNISLKISVQRQKPFQGTAKEWFLQNGGTMHCGDQFRIRFKSDAAAYIYIFLHSSSDKMQKLFPAGNWGKRYEQKYSREFKPQVNYCYAETTFYAPGRDGAGTPLFFELDQHTGRNTMFITANREKVKNIPSVLNALESADNTSDRKNMLRRKFGFDYVDTFVFEQRQMPEQRQNN